MRRWIVVSILLLAIPVSAQTIHGDHTTYEWGGARLFLEGREVRAPFDVRGYGTSQMFVNSIPLDPLQCHPPDPPEPRPWCLTGYQDYLELQECLHRMAQAQLVHELALHSGAPLVALGCDYFYAPEERAGRAVLVAIERKDGELARALGAPDDFVADFLNAPEPDLP